MKNRIRLILSFTIPYFIFILIMGTILVSIFIRLNKASYYNEISINIDTAKWNVENKVNDIINSIDLLSSYASVGVNANNIAKSITNVKKIGNYYDVFYCNTIPYNRGGIFISSRISYPDNYDQTTREWYVESSKSQSNLYITAPYIDFTSGNLVVTFLYKVMVNNSLAGYIGIDFDNVNSVIDNNNNFIESINIVTENGLYITHENSENVLNENVSLFSDNLFSVYKNNMNDNSIKINNNYWYALYKIDNAPWYIAFKGNAQEYYNSIRYLIIFLVGIALLFIIGEVIIVSVSLVPISDRLDDVILCIENMSNGNFSSRIIKNEKSNESTVRLYNVIEKMQKNIGKTMYKIKTGVEEVNKNGEAIANVSIELSNKANEQSIALEGLVEAIKAISSSIEYAANKTDEAKKMSDESSNNTKLGVEMINEIEKNMQEITESSNAISNIIATIQSIASQTNILALNAAVEAARAGDQGRGFAVVANEVRSLAQTVTDSADNITDIVQGAVSKIEYGTEFVSKSSEALNSIETSVFESSNSLSGIYKMSNDKRVGINNINNIVAKINDITKSNAKFAQESADSSTRASKIVNEIVNELSFFKFKSSDN
ncbi:methyl-accepting chemotaxis protein [uncultured Brachyspira sp.]|uniref:methyl-accepting chemotaxis protein n=1 Tax=uncultured Brachyspira sp. TaxID=221953 RepID=UPI0026370D4C|nr:methyl-accepting chemotaxis protein [uncultured Brachyspira sp.]